VLGSQGSQIHHRGNVPPADPQYKLLIPDRPLVLLIAVCAAIVSCSSGKIGGNGRTALNCHPSNGGGKKQGTTQRALHPRTKAADDGSEIRVVALYTAEAKAKFDAASKNIERALNNAVAQINSGLAFNNLDLRVTAALIGPTDYINASSFNDDLTRIRDEEGGTTVRKLQNDNAADVVIVVAVKKFAGDDEGISYLLHNDGLDYSDSGIEVINWTCVDESYRCVAHEFGHVLGVAHDRGTDSYRGWSSNYSFGYCFRANDGSDHGDLMAYQCADRREVLFSDPLSVFKVRPGDTGVPTGVAEFNAAGQRNSDAADAARTE
jgi:hypothetical protein